MGNNKMDKIRNKIRIKPNKNNKKNKNRNKDNKMMSLSNN